MGEAWPGAVGRPVKLNARHVNRFLKAMREPVPDPREKGGTRPASNAEAAARAGWGESTLYLYLSIARGVRGGRDHPDAARLLEFLEQYEVLDLAREEARIDAARRVIADDLAGRRVRKSLKTTAVTISGTTPLQRLVAALEGEPIATIAQLYSDRGIGKAFLAAREVAQAGERVIKVEKFEEEVLPSLIAARWQEDRTRYRHPRETAADVDTDGDPDDLLPRLRMLLGGDPDLRQQVRDLCDELAAEG